MRKLIYAACVPALMLLASCKKDLPDYGTTATVKMANGWWVIFYKNGVQQTNPVFLSTHNTAANTADSMWIDDINHGYGFQCKVKVDYTNLTFSATNTSNAFYVADPTAGYAATVTFTDGKILPKAGHSQAGNITDSIYVKAVFSDTPANTWTIAGTARTGFIEDDY